MSTSDWTKVAASAVPPNRRRGGDLRTLLSPATAGSTSGFMGVLTIQPDECVTEHYHPYSEEFLYVVEGELVIRLNGEPVRLGVGEALFIPINMRHRLENPGDGRAFVTFGLGPLAPRPDLGHVDTEQPGADGRTPRNEAGEVR